jgi:hypothetical protein
VACGLTIVEATGQLPARVKLNPQKAIGTALGTANFDGGLAAVAGRAGKQHEVILTGGNFQPIVNPQIHTADPHRVAVAVGFAVAGSGEVKVEQ